MPIEYAIRNCELHTIKLMFTLGATAEPIDILKLAVCRGDLHILAQVLVYLIENKKLA